jgi:hypothetical protein
VTTKALTPELLAPFIAKLRTRLADMTVDFERVDEIPRRPNGKFQPIVSTIDRRPA